MVRGINQQDIFHEEDDYAKYWETIKKVGVESGITVLGYCLMTNHVHLLVKERGTDLAVFMKRLGVSYAYWYNWKYERSGHLFQDRFKSETVENDAYLLTVIRYIHKNPVQANIVKNPEEYRWSSCADYCKSNNRKDYFTDTELILGMFSDQENQAIERFREFMQDIYDDQCLDIGNNERLSDAEAYRILTELIKGKPVSEFHAEDKERQNRVISKLRHKYGLSLRQISRITGIPLHIIRKV